jgi:hypothetical protein
MLVSGAAAPPRSLAGGAVPADGGTAPIGRDGDEIEAAGCGSQPGHRPAKGLDLCIGEVLERSRAGLYFDGNDHTTVTDDQVDFSAACSDVAADDGTTPADEKPSRNLLAEGA